MVDRQADRQTERKTAERSDGRTSTSCDQKKIIWGFISGELCDKKYKKPFDEDKVNLPIHFMYETLSYSLPFANNCVIKIIIFTMVLFIWVCLRNIRNTILLNMNLYTLNGPRSKTFKVLSSSSLKKLWF